MGIERDDIDRIATASADQVMEQVEALAGELLEEALGKAPGPTVEAAPPPEAAPCDPIPLKQWIEEEDPDQACRACILPFSMSWYRDELAQRGLDDLAGEMETVSETGDPDKVAGVMDSIKERVDPEVAERLRYFDCALQAFQPTEEELELINAGSQKEEAEG